MKDLLKTLNLQHTWQYFELIVEEYFTDKEKCLELFLYLKSFYRDDFIRWLIGNDDEAEILRFLLLYSYKLEVGE